MMVTKCFAVVGSGGKAVPGTSLKWCKFVTCAFLMIPRVCNPVKLLPKLPSFDLRRRLQNVVGFGLVFYVLCSILRFAFILPSQRLSFSFLKRKSQTCAR